MVAEGQPVKSALRRSSVALLTRYRDTALNRSRRHHGIVRWFPTIEKFNVEPSDDAVDLIAASELMGVPMLDHLVMGWGVFGSIRTMRAELWG